jgi:deoxyribonuclease V
VQQLARAKRVVLSDSAAGFAIPTLPRRGLAAAGAGGGGDDDDGDGGAAPPPLRFVGGVDISFVKESTVAVAALVVMSYPALEVLHTEMHHCDMGDVPYIPGYLAFREVDPLLHVLKRVRAEHPAIAPQLLLVDGNGVHHHRGCGLASHIGVVADIPTLGCAKNLLTVDGLTRDGVAAMLAQDRAAPAAAGGKKAVAAPKLHRLVGVSGTLLGHAVLTGNSVKNPIYVSAGHRISQLTAAALVVAMAKFRVVEPVRQADLRSREYVKKYLGDAAAAAAAESDVAAPVLPGTQPAAEGAAAAGAWNAEGTGGQN